MSNLIKFKTTLYEDSHQSNTTNVSSTDGARQYQERTYHSTIEVFYLDGDCNLIYVLSDSSKTVSEGDYGSYTHNDYCGYLYIAKNDSDKAKALSLLKNGTLPDGTIGRNFMANFDEAYYDRNENIFPLIISISSERDNIIKALKLDLVALNFYYYDDFVGEDGLHAYVSEDLNNEDSFSQSHFYDIITDSNKRCELLWMILSIEEAYDYECSDGENMLKWSDFGKIIKQGFKNLALTDSECDLEARINAIKEEVQSLKDLKALQKKNAEESNAKWRARNPDATFLTEDEKKNMTVGELKSKPEHINRVKLLNKIHKQYFKTTKDLSYEEYFDYIVDKLVNNTDGVDTDYAFYSLQTLYSSLTEKTAIELKSIDTNMSDAYHTLSKDFGVSYSSVEPLLGTPIRTCLQVLQTTLN